MVIYDLLTHNTWWSQLHIKIIFHLTNGFCKLTEIPKLKIIWPNNERRKKKINLYSLWRKNEAYNWHSDPILESVCENNNLAWCLTVFTTSRVRQNSAMHSNTCFYDAWGYLRLFLDQQPESVDEDSPCGSVLHMEVSVPPWWVRSGLLLQSSLCNGQIKRDTNT